MYYSVEIQRERENLTKIMAEIREWLDAQHFEPDAFRCCSTGDERVTCRLEFKVKAEAAACAKAFGGEIGRVG